MKVFGVVELAEALGVQPGTIHQWRKRGKFPEPSQLLATGPVWYGRAIEKLIAAGGPESKPLGRPRKDAG